MYSSWKNKTRGKLKESGLWNQGWSRVKSELLTHRFALKKKKKEKKILYRKNRGKNSLVGEFSLGETNS